VTFLVDGLEKQGMVSRTVDEVDRRVVYVDLTASGKEVCSSITPAVVDVFSRLGSVFSEEEKDQFLEYLFRFLHEAQQDYLSDGIDDSVPADDAVAT
jgi:DNA-binding MarR family transcriptional regulator